jgi:hypothetical protein
VLLLPNSAPATAFSNASAASQNLRPEASVPELMIEMVARRGAEEMAGQ